MEELKVCLPGYAKFRMVVKQLTGIDLDSYKAAQVERRLGTIMRRAGASDLAAYAQLISEDHQKVRDFQDTFLINVSEWLRNTEKWDEFRTIILPEMLKRSSKLRIWSAGCSIGCEPYSLSMILDQIDPHGQHEIIASDFDDEALAYARAGVYADRDIKNVDEQRRSAYFTHTPEGNYLVKPNLRSRITFEKRNLLTEPAPKDCDMILCRNVVIYFTEDTKSQLYQKFVGALKAGGILWVGSTELILQAKELGLSTRLPFFYQAVEVSPLIRT